VQCSNWGGAGSTRGCGVPAGEGVVLAAAAAVVGGVVVAAAVAAAVAVAVVELLARGLGTMAVSHPCCCRRPWCDWTLEASEAAWKLASTYHPESSRSWMDGWMDG
jgi:hypothetical protein